MENIPDVQHCRKKDILSFHRKHFKIAKLVQFCSISNKLSQNDLTNFHNRIG